MRNKYIDEVEVCTKCKREFIRRLIVYPCKCDDKRDSFYLCPYCEEHYSIQLMGDEDVTGIKMKED